jgi:hypothetical protein
MDDQQHIRAEPTGRKLHYVVSLFRVCASFEERATERVDANAGGLPTTVKEALMTGDAEYYPATGKLESMTYEEFLAELEEDDDGKEAVAEDQVGQRTPGSPSRWRVVARMRSRRRRGSEA